MKRLFKFPKLNIMIFALTGSDIATWGIFNILSTFIGIFLSNKLGMNAVQVVGIGLGIYTFTRAIFQIPVGLIADKLKSTNDEVILLIIGNLLMGIPYAMLVFVSNPGMYYLIQAIFGIGGAINLVAWRKLFALSLDKDKEGLEYAIYGTLFGLFGAAISTIAGLISNISETHFNVVIFVLGLIIANSWIFGVWVLKIKRNEEIKMNNERNNLTNENKEME